MIRTIQTAQLTTGHRLIMACDLPVVGHSLWIMDFDHNGKPTMDWQQLPTPLFVDIKEKDKILPVCDNTIKNSKVSNRILSVEEAEKGMVEDLQKVVERSHFKFMSKRKAAFYALGFDQIIISMIFSEMPSNPEFFKTPRMNFNLNIDHRTVGKTRNNHVYLNSIFVGAKEESTPLNFPSPTHFDIGGQ